MSRLATALLMLAGIGCRAPRHPAGEPPLRVELSQRSDGTGLRLRAAAGQRINARLAPALELADGSILRFTAPVDADSAYFTADPTALAPFRADTVHGLLRAGLCEKGADVCRVVEVRL